MLIVVVLASRQASSSCSAPRSVPAAFLGSTSEYYILDLKQDACRAGSHFITPPSAWA